MVPKKVSRRSTKPRGPSRQASRSRKQCDICAMYCFIESMTVLVLPGIRSYTLCPTCGGIFSDVARGRNHDSESMRRAFPDQEARIREAQRQDMKVLERLREEQRRGRELEKLRQMDGETERTWWNTPINEQSPEELIKGMAAMEKLMFDLDKYLAEQDTSSSSAATTASTSASIGPSHVGSYGGPAISVDMGSGGGSSPTHVGPSPDKN
ncbi:hypothetical protein CDL15_Pgr015885 [Punica granatum]|uniref:Uncharacterized protein n=1 Tax=Punica granatum TaxID=22663 RepID=A0A218XQA3_PUNGR|nr:hypothetical protein CDL15_Pgr015885 [Punica granatum]PKI37128.1 hypothetical protein CRG98_042463 [Punica granatum]